eukprot:748650-Hanusia_phi.AAC.4
MDEKQFNEMARRLKVLSALCWNSKVSLALRLRHGCLRTRAVDTRSRPSPCCLLPQRGDHD